MSNLTASIGKNIRAYRKAKNLTISDLASMINKSNATISKYENGGISIDIETIFEIADALNIEYFQLINYKTHKQSFEKGVLENPFGGTDILYLYFYDGRIGKIVKNVVRMLYNENDESMHATFFSNIHSFDTYQNCESLYFGNMKIFDSVTYFFFENQTNHIEHLNITVFNPIKKTKMLTALLSGISHNPLMPVSIKVIISKDILTEDDALKDILYLQKEDYKLMKKFNMFSIQY